MTNYVNISKQYLQLKVINLSHYKFHNFKKLFDIVFEGLQIAKLCYHKSLKMNNLENDDNILNFFNSYNEKQLGS